MSIAVVPLRIQQPQGGSVSATLRRPRSTKACLVFAHGAGAGMDYTSMTDMTAARKRLELPPCASSSLSWIKAVADRIARATRTRLLELRTAARDAIPAIPLFACGKAFEGRMTSQAQSEQPLDGVLGLVFFGFPLHPAGKPGIDRVDHLGEVGLPMLFIQGTRNALADLGLIKQVTTGLGPRTALHLVEGADHAFHVLARSGRRDADVIQDMAGAAAIWMNQRILVG